jgi:hypothetical protein
MPKAVLLLLVLALELLLRVVLLHKAVNPYRVNKDSLVLVVVLLRPLRPIKLLLERLRLVDNKLAAKILLHFDFKTMEVLNEYISERRATVYKKMERASFDEFRQLQGELHSLNQLQDIRKHAEAVKEVS